MAKNTHSEQLAAMQSLTSSTEWKERDNERKRQLKCCIQYNKIIYRVPSIYSRHQGALTTVTLIRVQNSPFSACWHMTKITVMYIMVHNTDDGHDQNDIYPAACLAAKQAIIKHSVNCWQKIVKHCTLSLPWIIQALSSLRACLSSSSLTWTISSSSLYVYWNHSNSNHRLLFLF